MTDNTTPTGVTQGASAQVVSTNRLDQGGEIVAGTAEGARTLVVAKPQIEAIILRGQKHVPPSGRHSQQSHRRAQQRASAEGHATIQEHHASDRSTLKAEIGRLAALKAARKTKPLI